MRYRLVIGRVKKNLNNFYLRNFKSNYKPIFLRKVIKHQFSHFTLFSQIIIVDKDKMLSNKLIGKWVNRISIKKFPISNLTKSLLITLWRKSSLSKFL